MMQQLGAGQRETLDALCRCLVPAAYDNPGTHLNLAGLVEQQLSEAEPSVRRRFALLLTLFGSALNCATSGGRWLRFGRTPPEQQDTLLRAWERSSMPARRTVFQAFRRLILSTYYAQPESHAAIGYRGPLYRRGVVLPWEGALPGDQRDDEPVARNHQPAVLPVPARAAPPGGVVQGHEVASDLTLTADVCVIGTGAGGAVVAARLAEAGQDVVLLEEGGYWTPADFTESEAEMVPRLYADRGLRTTEDLAVSLLQGRCVGGGTTVNWMMTLRTPDFVLDEWSRLHAAEGMSAAAMTTVFDRIEDEIHARPIPDDAHNPNNNLLMDGAARLGWTTRAAVNNARECVRAGFCGIGCRYDAKQSALNTYVPRALAAGARLYSDVRVERLEIAGPGGRRGLKRVRCTVLDRDTGAARRSLVVNTPTVVLAAGAVGTPVILQRSGLGGGGVGRFLRLHPTTAAMGIYDREIYGPAGIPQSALCDDFLRGNGDGYGFWIECPALLPGLAAAAVTEFGASHRRIMQRFASFGSLIVLVRDGAELDRSDGSVTVGRGGRVKIRYRISQPTARMLRDGTAAAARVHLAAGATEVQTLHSPAVRLRSEADLGEVHTAACGHNQINLFSAHVNGTCRIGGSPRTSGCTPEFERHGAPGIYVADGSLLPTAPGVNPQLTIMAVADVAAGRILARLR
ncbi:MAG TPA: GMC family oxidoreductase N-terminal domain-containing protein [Gemmatimonadaceae bacterium]